MQREDTSSNYNFTNPIEGIEGGYVEYDEENDGYSNFRATSFFEILLKMVLECANVNYKHLRCAVFIQRTILEIMLLFSFIGFLAIMIMW